MHLDLIEMIGFTENLHHFIKKNHLLRLGAMIKSLE